MFILVSRFVTNHEIGSTISMQHQQKKSIEEVHEISAELVMLNIHAYMRLSIESDKCNLYNHKHIFNHNHQSTVMIIYIHLLLHTYH